MGRPGRLAYVAGAVAVALLCTRPVSADLVKCNSGIEKNGAKLQAAIVKALQKCKNAAAKPGADPATVAAGCQATFSKSIDASNPASTLQKTKVALESLVTKLICTDDDLAALGHLSEALFADRWSSWVILSALKAAYEEQLWLAGDTINILLTLGDTGSCDLCKTLGRPPCAKVPCSLSSASQALVKTGGPPPATITVPLTGVAIFEGCQFPGLFPNEIAVIGNPALGIKPATVLTATVCTVGIRTEGVTSCAGSTAPAVSYQTCQDHNIQGGVDDCDAFLGAGAICQPDHPDTNPMHAGVTNGGPCAKFTAGASAPGASFAVNTSQLTVEDGTQFGPDGIPCNLDDSAPPGMPAAIPITTESASADIFDYNNNAGNHQTTGTITGVRQSNCGQLQQGNLNGLTLVGAFPAVDALPLSPTVKSDTLTTLKLVCQ